MAREDIPLDFRPNNLVGRERTEEREKREKKKVEREALPSLYIFRRSDQRFLVDQEEKCFTAQRVSSRDRKRGVSKNSKR